MVCREIQHDRTLHLADNVQEAVHLGFVDFPALGRALVQPQQLQRGGVADLHVTLRAARFQRVQQAVDGRGAVQLALLAEGVGLVHGLDPDVGNGFIAQEHAFHRGRDDQGLAARGTRTCLCMGRHGCQGKACGDQRGCVWKVEGARQVGHGWAGGQDWMWQAAKTARSGDGFVFKGQADRLGGYAADVVVQKGDQALDADDDGQCREHDGSAGGRVAGTAADDPAPETKEGA